MIIQDTYKDALGAMLLDYLAGKHDACLEVESSTLDMSIMCGELMFRSYQQMSGMEQMALDLCDGRILDAGAGSGCHSLYLQEMGNTVDSLDISPGCIEVMKNRSIRNPLHANLFSLNSGQYDTILMLMNGLGLCGSLTGLDVFLQRLQILLKDGGQLIADSTDLTSLYDKAANYGYELDGYMGETEFVMRYNDIVSEPFDWLYVDYEMLQMLVKSYGMQAELLMAGAGGQYLCRVFSAQ